MQSLFPPDSNDKMIKASSMTRATVMIAVAANGVLHCDAYGHYNAGTAIPDTSGKA